MNLLVFMMPEFKFKFVITIEDDFYIIVNYKRTSIYISDSILCELSPQVCAHISELELNKLYSKLERIMENPEVYEYEMCFTKLMLQ